MKDAVVSVRIPVSIIQELKTLTKSNHYIDLSEQIREIIRQKILQYSTEEKEQKQTAKEQTNDKKAILEQLQKLIEELKKEP